MNTRKKNVYVVMGHSHLNKNTWLSATFSNKKKAEAWRDEIFTVMEKNDPAEMRTYWVIKEKVN